MGAEDPRQHETLCEQKREGIVPDYLFASCVLRFLVT